MASDHWRQIEELYQSALKRGAAERGALLAKADSGLRREVESLLAERGDSTATQIAAGFQLRSYRIEAPIGEGGMGTVYRALDTKLNRPVAVKFLFGAAMEDICCTRSIPPRRATTLWRSP